jgi:cardiolipin synthase
MTQGYLIPDDDVVAALHQAASRGVDVRIVIPAESNHVIADWLSRGYYDRLLH